MWILGTLYCCSFPLSLANWGQRTGLFLIYLTWCSKTGSIIAPPLTKPLSSSSCFLLLTSCHHQSFTFYLFSHLISQNHHWLYFLSIFLPYFFFFTIQQPWIWMFMVPFIPVLSFFFLLLPSTLHLRDLCLGWELWVCVGYVCVCVHVRLCVWAPWGGSSGDPHSLPLCPWAWQTAGSPSTGTHCWSGISVLVHCVSFYSQPGPSASLLWLSSVSTGAVGLLVSPFPDSPFLQSQNVVAKLWAPWELCLV